MELTIELITAIGAIIVLVIERSFKLIKDIRTTNELSDASIKAIVNAIIIENRNKSSCNFTNDVENKIQALFEWHDKDDKDGNKLWYNKESLYNSIKEIEKTLNKLLVNKGKL